MSRQPKRMIAHGEAVRAASEWELLETVKG